ncbi:unnamed protein product [Blepharisma stoltei]|uniref:Uncharacterized protein n=1 Tax=Blepharisma stoltei TaxID=1481888 RepID=A0AAU9IRN1_9CILI|nr:unnamed protein product [Blepharisma stoltei]
MSENPAFKPLKVKRKEKLDNNLGINELNARRLFRKLSPIQSPAASQPLSHMQMFPAYMIDYKKWKNESETKKKRSPIRIQTKIKFSRNLDTLQNLQPGDCAKYIKSCFKGRHKRHHSTNSILDFAAVHNASLENTNCSTRHQGNSDDSEEEPKKLQLKVPQSRLDLANLRKIKMKLSKSELHIDNCNLSITEKKKRKQERWRKIERNIEEYNKRKYNTSSLSESMDSQANIAKSSNDLLCICKDNGIYIPKPKFVKQTFKPDTLEKFSKLFRETIVGLCKSTIMNTHIKKKSL